MTYDLGYVYGLSLSFAQIPTSISDHARSIFFWLPTILPIAVFCLFLLGLEKPNIQSTVIVFEGSPQLQIYNPRTRWLILSAAVAILLVLGCLALLYRGIRPLSVLLGLVVIWFVVYMQLMHVTSLKQFSDFVSKFVYFTPVGLIVLFAIGYWEGSNDQRPSESRFNATIEYKDGARPDTQIVILRTFEKAFLVATKENQAKVVMASEIHHVAFARPKKEPTIGAQLLCYSFDLMCNKEASRPGP